MQVVPGRSKQKRLLSLGFDGAIRVVDSKIAKTTILQDKSLWSKASLFGRSKDSGETGLLESPPRFFAATSFFEQENTVYVSG